MRVLISTGDKDMAQLVDDRVTLVNTMTDSSLDRAGVKTKFDVYPEQIVDYLALVGDTSDNIPGVPKVGPKTAAKWLNEYDDARHAAGARRTRSTARSARACARTSATLALSRKLATIDCTLELAAAARATSAAARPTWSALRELYSQLELRSLLQQLPAADAGAARAGSPARAAVARRRRLDAERATDRGERPRHYDTILTEAQLDEWLQRLRSADLFAFDTETTSLDYMQAEIVGVSFCDRAGDAAYVPLGARLSRRARPARPRSAVLHKLKPLLEDADRAKVGHHLKYDAHVLRNHGIELARHALRHDARVLRAEQHRDAPRHGFRRASATSASTRSTTRTSPARARSRLPFSQVPIEQAAEYAAEDADVTLRLHRTLWPQLERLPRLQAALRGDRAAAGAGAARMEHHGVLIDTAMLRKQSHELAQSLLDARTVGARSGRRDLQPRFAEAAAGHPVRQAAAAGAAQDADRPALDRRGRARGTRRRATSCRASSSSTAASRSSSPPTPTSCRSRSIHAPGACTPPITRRSPRPAGCHRPIPNLQNIPIRTPEGRRIRQAFIAPPGHVLLAADYSQIELRIMAHLSGDEGLLRAFAEDRDIHQATAAEVFGAAARRGHAPTSAARPRRSTSD